MASAVAEPRAMLEAELAALSNNPHAPDSLRNRVVGRGLTQPEVRVAVFGTGKVGKSMLCERFTETEGKFKFRHEHVGTLQVDTLPSKELACGRDRVSVLVRDFPGNIQRARSVAESFKRSDAIVFAFCENNENSSKMLPTYLTYCVSNSPNALRFLAATQMDRVEDEGRAENSWVVGAEQWGADQGFRGGVHRTSALANTGVTELFTYVAEQVLAERARIRARLDELRAEIERLKGQERATIEARARADALRAEQERLEAKRREAAKMQANTNGNQAGSAAAGSQGASTETALADPSLSSAGYNSAQAQLNAASHRVDGRIPKQASADSASMPLVQVTSQFKPKPAKATKSKRFCFPSDSLVRLERGGEIVLARLGDVRVGDLVQSGPDTFEPVLVLIDHARFPFRDGASEREFVAIRTADAELRASGGHAVFVLEKPSAPPALKLARDVRQGDFVLVVPSATDTARPHPVLDVCVRSTVGLGAIAPATRSGAIVVDGVVASCLVEGDLPLPFMARAYPFLLAPLAFLCALLPRFAFALLVHAVVHPGLALVRSLLPLLAFVGSKVVKSLPVE